MRIGDQTKAVKCWQLQVQKRGRDWELEPFFELPLCMALWLDSCFKLSEWPTSTNRWPDIQTISPGENVPTPGAYSHIFDPNPNPRNWDSKRDMADATFAWILPCTPPAPIFSHRDGDGYLTLREFLGPSHQATSEAVTRTSTFFRDLDSDKDGRLDREEVGSLTFQSWIISAFSMAWWLSYIGKCRSNFTYLII